MRLNHETVCFKQLRTFDDLRSWWKNFMFINVKILVYCHMVYCILFSVGSCQRRATLQHLSSCSHGTLYTLPFQVVTIQISKPHKAKVFVSNFSNFGFMYKGLLKRSCQKKKKIAGTHSMFSVRISPVNHLKLLYMYLLWFCNIFLQIDLSIYC